MKSYKEKFLAAYKRLRALGYQPHIARTLARYEVIYEPIPRNPKFKLLDNPWGYDGTKDTPLPGGYTLRVEISPDYDAEPPYEDAGHGPVARRLRASLEDWEREWVLRWDSCWCYVYDVRAARQQAEDEGWGLGHGVTARKAAVQRDYDYLHGWFNEHWWYIGYRVTLIDPQGEEVDSDSCWRFETADMTYVVGEIRSAAACMLKRHMPRYWQRLRQTELVFEEAA